MKDRDIGYLLTDDYLVKGVLDDNGEVRVHGITHWANYVKHDGPLVRNTVKTGIVVEELRNSSQEGSSKQNLKLPQESKNSF